MSAANTAAKKPQGGEALKQIRYLAAALKAPRITESAARLADHARDAGWTHEDYLTAVLDREVAARNASGAQLRIRAAGFPARKTLEEFDWDAQPAVRQQIAALASGGFLTEAPNVVLLGPPGTGKTHLATGLGIAAANHGHRVLFATATDWVTRLTDAPRQGRLPQELTRLRRYGADHPRRGRLPALQRLGRRLRRPGCRRCRFSKQLSSRTAVTSADVRCLIVLSRRLSQRSVIFFRNEDVPDFVELESGGPRPWPAEW
jgi:IstB-like ATP binding protein